MWVRHDDELVTFFTKSLSTPNSAPQSALVSSDILAKLSRIACPRPCRALGRRCRRNGGTPQVDFRAERGERHDELTPGTCRPKPVPVPARFARNRSTIPTVRIAAVVITPSTS